MWQHTWSYMITYDHSWSYTIMYTHIWFVFYHVWSACCLSTRDIVSRNVLLIGCHVYTVASWHLALAPVLFAIFYLFGTLTLSSWPTRLSWFCMDFSTGAFLALFHLLVLWRCRRPGGAKVLLAPLITVVVSSALKNWHCMLCTAKFFIPLHNSSPGTCFCEAFFTCSTSSGLLGTCYFTEGDFMAFLFFSLCN